MLAARVFQGWETSDHLCLDARRKRLSAKLSDLSQDKSRPNNALYAETLLVLSRLTETDVKGNEYALDEVWKDLSGIIDRAKGLGEFPAELIDQVVDAMSSLVPESVALDDLAEKLAEFMGQRQKEGKAGEIYLRRGSQKLDHELPIEAVSWLGKASICFMKDEYREEQFETLYCLAVAYRGAGLLWAARAACLAALVQANAISAEDAETKVETIPTVSLLALISLQMGRVSDLLLCIFWMRGLQHSLPLDEVSKLRLEEKSQELDALISCFIAGVESESLFLLADVPDVFESLGLFSSQIFLMYRLGRAAELDEHGLIPEREDVSELAKMVNVAASQSASSNFPRTPVVNKSQKFLASISIIGVQVEISGGDSMEDIVLCEACVTAIESFFATAFSNKVWPKVENLKVHVGIRGGLSEPEFEFDPMSMTLKLAWPKGSSLLDASAVAGFGKYLIEFCTRAMDAIAVLPEEASLEHMITNESLLERTVSFSFAHFAQGRVFGNYLSSLNDLAHLVSRSYPPVEPMPTVVPLDVKEADEETVPNSVGNVSELSESSEHEYTPPNRHSDLAVSSVINTHLWDQAGWRGVLYAHSGPMDSQPPLLGLSFESKEMASSIFKEWNEKFGRKDTEDRIRISIIRGIDANNRHYYRVHVTQSINAERYAEEEIKTLVSVSRLNTMEPDCSTNLENFLEQFEKFGMFFLVPAVISVGGHAPELLLDHSILSRNLHIRHAWEIGENDQDYVAIRNSDNIIAPLE